MEQVIGEGGTIKMLFNFMSHDRQLFRINETISYDKIVKVETPFNKNCGCSGRIDTFYVVNGSKIPTSRAQRIN